MPVNPFQVNSNPILSLGRPFLEYSPVDFPIEAAMDDTNYFQLLENGGDCVRFANFSSSNVSDDYYGLLALFWADADPSANSPGGSIYYRMTRDDDTLKSIQNDVTSLHPFEKFVPTWAFILTYYNITYYYASSDSKVSFIE